MNTNLQFPRLAFVTFHVRIEQFDDLLEVRIAHRHDLTQQVVAVRLDPGNLGFAQAVARLDDQPSVALVAGEARRLHLA